MKTLKQTLTIETVVADNGSIITRQYLNALGRLDRDPSDGPACQSFYKDGQIEYQEFLVDGYWHRDPADGPAYESWYKDGKPKTKEWRFHQMKHRPVADGAALQYWDDKGNLSEYYYVKGIKQPTPSKTAPSNDLDGKTFEVDGKKYKLTLVE